MAQQENESNFAIADCVDFDLWYLGPCQGQQA